MFACHCRDAGNRMLVPLQGQGSNSATSDGASVMMVVVFLLFPFRQSHSAQTGFKLTAISPQPPRCWGCRHELLHPAGVLIVEDSSLIFGLFLALPSPISSFPLNMSTQCLFTCREGWIWHDIRAAAPVQHGGQSLRSLR